MKKIAIVPAYNEGLNIGRVVDELRAFDADLDVLVISDGSADRTAEVAAAHGAHVIKLPFNLGIGGAVQTGFQYAWENGYELAVRCDGDGQHDPAELPKVVAPVLAGTADICVGSRFTGSDGYRSSATRRVGIHLLAAIVSAIGHQRVTDTTSGFQALNRRALGLFAADYPHDYPEVEGMVMTTAAWAHSQRGGRDDARARARALVDHRASLDLLHGEGDHRSLRRSVPAPDRPAGGRMTLGTVGFGLLAQGTPLKVSIAATLASLVLVLAVFELIRSRRLQERYALLWLLTGMVLVVLSAWRAGLNTIAAWLGVRGYPPAVLFAVGLLFVIVVLLHYSTVISRLSSQNTILAQRLALLETKLNEGLSPEPAAVAGEAPASPATR